MEIWKEELNRYSEGKKEVLKEESEEDSCVIIREKRPIRFEES